MRFTTLSVLLLPTLSLATPDSDPAIEKRDDNTDSDLSNPLSNLYTYLFTYLPTHSLLSALNRLS